MIARHPSYRALRLLLVACVCLAPALLSGCGKKEETSPPGYYSGPMQGKNQKPAADGTAPAAKGKVGDN